MSELNIKPLLRYRTMAAFRLTVETRSATRAAEELGISQPAVSQLLAALERAVGFSLFNRGAGRRMDPTDQARQLLSEVREILDAMAALERRVRELAGDEGGQDGADGGRGRRWQESMVER
ncbi:hypothetical protein STVA_14220 [Allostella vacuolata]|nr:hypothetical protein STVA_14220 [Stella vacuolata]